MGGPPTPAVGLQPQTRAQGRRGALPGKAAVPPEPEVTGTEPGGPQRADSRRPLPAPVPGMAAVQPRPHITLASEVAQRAGCTLAPLRPRQAWLRVLYCPLTAAGGRPVSPDPAYPERDRRVSPGSPEPVRRWV